MEEETHEHRPHRRDVHEQTTYPGAAADVYADLKDKVAPLEGASENTTHDAPIKGLGTANALNKKLMEDNRQLGIEQDYDGIGIPSWREQLTVRAFVVSAILGTLFSIVVHRLNLSVGIIPSLNVSAGMLGFFLVKSYTTVLGKCGFKVKPFTRQENTVIQTCCVSCFDIAFSGGFGSYILGMSNFAYEKVGPTTAGNTIENVKNPSLSWIFPFTFITSLVGIFVLVPLRKIMIIDYKLTYPSGTATAVLINSFHTPTGGVVAKKQLRYVGKYFTFSFLFSFFKWFFSGMSDSCGFDTFPSLGLKAYSNRFFFDFNMTYVGAGMICPHLVNCSILLGAIVSWGLMWPLIRTKQGNWYHGSSTKSDFKGLFAYKVFISIALILGDGLYHLVTVTLITIRSLYVQHKTRQELSSLPTTALGEKQDLLDYDEQRRNEVFFKDGVPYWVAFAGYTLLSIISIIVLPYIFHPIKWYYVLVAYIIGPVFAFSNSYGAGLTDWSLASNYGKILLFIFAAWAGPDGGGIIAGLAACGVMMSIVSTASDLMQDFKTGYLTLSSPRSMFIAQLIGGLMGCVIAPSTFWLFYKAFNVGAPNSAYPAPFATIYRAMALVGVEGFGALPKHCLQLCAGWFAFAIVVCFIRDHAPQKYTRFIPLPMAMAIPFYLGAYFAIDMFIGTCIIFIWERINRTKARTFYAAVASGLICGDGVWIIPSAILNFAKVNPPLCMTFFPTKVAANLNYPLYTN